MWTNKVKMKALHFVSVHIAHAIQSLEKRSDGFEKDALTHLKIAKQDVEIVREKFLECLDHSPPETLAEIEAAVEKMGYRFYTTHCGTCEYSAALYKDGSPRYVQSGHVWGKAWIRYSSKLKAAIEALKYAKAQERQGCPASVTGALPQEERE
jgi:hypothetical protein